REQKARARSGDACGLAAGRRRAATYSQTRTRAPRQVYEVSCRQPVVFWKRHSPWPGKAQVTPAPASRVNRAASVVVSCRQPPWSVQRHTPALGKAAATRPLPARASELASVVVSRTQPPASA